MFRQWLRKRERAAAASALSIYNRAAHPLSKGKMIEITRRCLLVVSAGMALPAVVRPGFGQAKTKVAGAHASPVENAWNSRLHSALKEAAAEGKIDYVFSESIANTDYPRALRQYAETGAQLIVGESSTRSSARRARSPRTIQDRFPHGFLWQAGRRELRRLRHVEPRGELSYRHPCRLHRPDPGTFGSVGGYPIPEERWRHGRLAHRVRSRETSTRACSLPLRPARSSAFCTGFSPDRSVYRSMSPASASRCLPPTSATMSIVSWCRPHRCRPRSVRSSRWRSPV